MKEPTSMLKAKAGSARKFIDMTGDNRTKEMLSQIFQYVARLEVELEEKKLDKTMSEARFIVETKIKRSK